MSRYTPKKETKKLEKAVQKKNQRIVVPLMVGFIIASILTISLNYMKVLLPGAPSNWWLLIGLASLAGALITATQWE